MLKESISIKNFGPLVDVNISEIKKLNVFIGDSGSGKSTIMKVLVLFQWLFKQIGIRSYLKKSGIKDNPQEFNFKEYLANNGISDYLRKDTEIIYTRGKYVISYKSGRLNTRIDLDDEDLSLEKMSYISDKRNLIPDLYADKVPEDRISDFFLKETLNDFKIVVKDLQEVLVPAVKVSVIKRNGSFGKDELYVKDGEETNPYEIHMEDSSSGMQNVIPMYLIIQYFATKYNMTESAKNTIRKYMFDTDMIEKFGALTPAFNLADIQNNNIHLHIEEPELSLYPDGQIQLLQDLIDICYKKNNKKYNISMVISTHSPYIMNYLNLVIKNRNLNFDEIAAYQVKDGEVLTLMRSNNQVVDTRALSDPIGRIYKKYNS